MQRLILFFLVKDFISEEFNVLFFISDLELQLLFRTLQALNEIKHYHSPFYYPSYSSSQLNSFTRDSSIYSTCFMYFECSRFAKNPFMPSTCFTNASKRRWLFLDSLVILRLSKSMGLSSSRKSSLVILKKRSRLASRVDLLISLLRLRQSLNLMVVVQRQGFIFNPQIFMLSASSKSMYNFKDHYVTLLTRQISSKPQNNIDFYAITDQPIKTVSALRKRMSRTLQGLEWRAQKLVREGRGEKFLLQQIYQKFNEEKFEVQLDNRFQSEDVKNLERWNKSKKISVPVSNLYLQHQAILRDVGEKVFDNQLISEMMKHMRKKDYATACFRIVDCSKYYENETKIIEKTMKHEQTNLKRKIDQIEKKLSQLVAENDRLRSDMHPLTSQLKQRKKKLLSNISKIQQYEEALKELKKISKKFKSSCVFLYKNLLNMGYDVRSSGISWIVKRLQELQEKIEEKDLPGFFDQKANKFFLQVCQLQAQIERMQGKRKQILQIYNKNFNKTASINSLPQTQLGDITRLNAEQVRQQQQVCLRMERTDKLQKQFSKSAWGWRQFRKWNEISKGVFQQCKSTSSNLLYSQIKKRIRAVITNKGIRKDCSKRSLEKEQLIAEHNKIQTNIIRFTADLQAKRDREKKRLINQLKKKDLNPVRLVAQVAALFGSQTAQKVIRTNEVLKKLSE